MKGKFYRTVLGGKIHRGRVTEANLDYVGSISIDAALLEKAGIIPGEKVDVLNITNGNRISTYTIAEAPGSGIIQINGAAAHLFSIGDLVIIISYLLIADCDIESHHPKIVHLDEKNQTIDIGTNSEEF